MCLREIDSDLLVLHRLDDPARLSLWDWLRRVEFLPSYEGAVRTRLRLEWSKAEPAAAAAQTSAPAPHRALVDPTDDEIRTAMDAARQRRFPGQVIHKVTPRKLIQTAR
jgi:hypothetical protein